jgi:hypothetical protein
MGIDRKAADYGYVLASPVELDCSRQFRFSSKIPSLGTSLMIRAEMIGTTAEWPIPKTERQISANWQIDSANSENHRLLAVDSAIRNRAPNQCKSLPSIDTKTALTRRIRLSTGKNSLSQVKLLSRQSADS